MDDEAGQFLKKNAAYIAAGIVVLYLLYTYMSGSSSSTSATTVAGTNAALAQQSQADTAAIQLAQTQGQVQYALAATQAQEAVQVASINDSANVAVEQTLASAQAYATNINANMSVANTAIAATQAQNVAGYNALATGFSNFMVGSSNEVATAAAATSNIASSNNATGQQVAQDIQSVANLVSSVYGMGSGFGGYMSNAYGNILQPATTIPVYVGTQGGYSLPANTMQPTTGLGSFTTTTNAPVQLA